MKDKFIIVVSSAGYEVTQKKRFVLYCTCPDRKKADLIIKALNALESEK